MSTGAAADPGDARTVAVVAIRTKGLRQVVLDDERLALRLLSERRRELVRSRTETVNHLHQLLMELLPAGAEQKLTATKAKALLATVRPRHAAGEARRQLAVDFLDDLVTFDRKIKDINGRIKTAVEATGTTLTNIKGVVITTAAVVLGEVGDVRRFPSKHHFASYTGTAPLEVSSGEVLRHRLSRAGNRKLNSALHHAAMSHKRTDEQGIAYYERKVAEGKGKKGALRCMKRRLSDAVYRVLLEDQARADAAGREGHSGATLQSSASDPTPPVSPSDRSLTRPAAADATPQQPRAKRAS